MRILEKKRGVALIWAVVVSTILILITTTMVNSTLKESRISLRSDISATAYAAANSGIEIGKKLIDASAVTPNTDKPLHLDTDTIVNVHFSKDGNGNWIIDSTGSVGSVARKIQYKYISFKPKRLNFTELSASQPNNGSFTFNYNFWFPSTNRPNQFNFGYGNDPASPTNYVWLKYVEVYDAANAGAGNPTCTSYPAGKQQAILIKYQNSGINGGNAVPSTPICLGATTFNLGDPNFLNSLVRFEANLRYLDGAAFQLVLYKYDIVTGVRTCLGSTSLPLSDAAFVNFAKTYLNKIYYYVNPSPGTINQMETPYKFEITAQNGTKVDFESLQFYK